MDKKTIVIILICVVLGLFTIGLGMYEARQQYEVNEEQDKSEWWKEEYDPDRNWRNYDFSTQCQSCMSFDYLFYFSRVYVVPVDTVGAGHFSTVK